MGYTYQGDLISKPFIGKAANFGFVAFNKTAIYVVFRGTDPKSIVDWAHDLDTTKVSLGNGIKVHAGFDAETEDLFDSVQTVLNEARRGQANLQIILVGHSLGGAIAILTAATLHTQLYPIGGVYTYGGPRVYNYRGAQIYNESLGDVTFRTVNGQDVVPHLPTLFMNFDHVGTRFHVKSTATKSLWVSIREFLFGGLSDHSMDRYIKSMQQAIK